MTAADMEAVDEARNRAVARLIDENRARFDELLAEERGGDPGPKAVWA